MMVGGGEGGFDFPVNNRDKNPFFAGLCDSRAMRRASLVSISRTVGVVTGGTYGAGVGTVAVARSCAGLITSPPSTRVTSMEESVPVPEGAAAVAFVIRKGLAGALVPGLVGPSATWFVRTSGF